MLIGREKELHMLSEMYASKNFRFLLMYGRHRVGITSLLREFAKKKDPIYFSTQVKNDQLNLADFSEVLHLHFDKGSFGSFSDWESAFAFLNSKIGDKRLLIIIEGFHHLVAEHPSIIRLLQTTIDRYWRTKNIFLIISDTDAAFMENVMLGYSSPFYGMVTGQMIISPIDYLDCGKFYPEYSAEDKLMTYGILGGIPCYTGQFDQSRTVADNVAMRILNNGSFLRGEPLAILNSQFRDPAVYNSILEAVASGAHRMNDVSVRIHEESQKCAKYLNTLRSNWLIDKITPVGDDELSKKSLYLISGNFYRFWYRFVFKDSSRLEFMEPEEAAKAILQSESFGIYMSEIFEDVCREYILRKAVAGKLPLAPSTIGKWWSGSSRTKKTRNIDVVAIDRDKGSALFGICKYSDAPLDEAEVEDFLKACHSFGKLNETHYYLFSKSGFADGIKDKLKKVKNVKQLGLDDLYKA